MTYKVANQKGINDSEVIQLSQKIDIQIYLVQKFKNTLYVKKMVNI
ncbi:Spo0E family sporulation regulatory protein-aspartic acid phosphatase [Neobacillus cucumis]